MIVAVYRCLCPCHDPVDIERGVSTTDPIEAVTACQYCLNDHVLALTFKPPEHWDPENDATGDEGRET